jgi:hypothetical protein
VHFDALQIKAKMLPQAKRHLLLVTKD